MSNLTNLSKTQKFVYLALSNQSHRKKTPLRSALNFGANFITMIMVCALIYGLLLVA